MQLQLDVIQPRADNSQTQEFDVCVCVCVWGKVLGWLISACSV